VQLHHAVNHLERLPLIYLAHSAVSRCPSQLCFCRLCRRAVVGQVYVAEPGYVLGRAAVPKFAIITSLAGVSTPDLMTFASVLCSLPHGARTPLEYYTFSERHRRKTSILQVRLGGKRELVTETEQIVANSGFCLGGSPRAEP
jgi:hypothetical protein